MPAFVTVGRILFVVLFVFSGASKLFDIASTTQAIAEKVVLPAALTQYTAQLETITGMPTAQLLAILTGVLEVAGGLFIALNIGTRFFALVLVLFVAVTTFYFHNFWDMTGADRINNLIHALKNLSLIGGLLIIAGYPRQIVMEESSYTGV
ncbi:MAG TPA: DoxX family protein [Afipia sp.]